jgi:hypothetical protein
MDLSAISALMVEQGHRGLNDQTACEVDKAPELAQESTDVATCAASETKVEAQALDAVLNFLQGHTESASMDGIKSTFDVVKDFCQRLHANRLGGQSLATVLEDWRRQQVDLNPVTHRAYRAVQDIIFDAFSRGSTSARLTDTPCEQARNKHRPSTVPQVSQREANVEHQQKFGHFHPDRVAMLENTPQDDPYEGRTEERVAHKLTGANRLAAQDHVEIAFHARRSDGRSRRLSIAAAGQDDTARVEQPNRQRATQQISSAKKLVVQSNGEPASGLGRTVFHPDRMAMIAASSEDSLTDQLHVEKPATRKLPGVNRLTAQDNVAGTFRARQATDRGSELSESKWRATQPAPPWSSDRGSQQESEWQRSEMPARQKYRSPSPRRRRRPFERDIDRRILSRQLVSPSLPELFGQPPTQMQGTCPRSRSRSPEASAVEHYDAWQDQYIEIPCQMRPESHVRPKKPQEKRNKNEPCSDNGQPGEGGKFEETQALSFPAIPPGDYICKRCGGNDHYLQDCPTHLNPAYDVVPMPNYICAICGAAGKHLLNVCPQNTDPGSITQQRLSLWQADRVPLQSFHRPFKPEGKASSKYRESWNLNEVLLDRATETRGRASIRSRQDSSRQSNTRGRSPRMALARTHENIDHGKDIQVKAMPYAPVSKADMFNIWSLQRNVETPRLLASEASSSSNYHSADLSASAESPIIRLGTPIIELGVTTKPLIKDPPYEPRLLQVWGNRPNIWVNKAARPTALEL